MEPVCPVIRVTQKRERRRERERDTVGVFVSHARGRVYMYTHTHDTQLHMREHVHVQHTTECVSLVRVCVASESVGGEWTGEELARIDNAMDALWSRNCVAPGYQISDSKRVSERKIHAG